MRINKYLSEAGVASRRKADELIAQGRVEINSKKAEIGMQVEEGDKITVDDEEVKLEKKAYYAFYKPKGYVTTTKEEHGMKTIMDIIDVPETVFPAGRLDKDAEGILILTNDGEFANKITHPRYLLEKTYMAELDKPFKGKLKNVEIEGRKVEVKKPKVEKEKVTLTIHEGRKHIVKKIFAKLGYKVIKLKRLSIGPIRLKDLRPGKLREIPENTIRTIKSTQR